ncbi:DsbA family protein [Psychromonas sp. psych-6C06]|uniref:DsbA family protein n=1 Tax=Psychromonas sp. psych-6C06 TaxID=2058089 RepID=UPI000C32FE70|nr:DsbA family protein [Psychromonas sp. psych-6C06]PKF62661.1 DsbA family protein [Psychromonas sp. psych-6C06]
MSDTSSNSIQLYYVYDPMCSWCWGYRPTWLALKKALQTEFPNIQIQYRVGGLAPDSEHEMPQDMQHFLQQTWHKIAAQLGTTFNFDFWQQCTPRRSTYPACRACLIARKSGHEEQMILAIQHAYYLQAQNPSDSDTLMALAAKLGLNQHDFSQALHAPLIEQQLQTEIESVRQLPIQGFPSLVLTVNGQHHAISIDYHHWQNSFNEIVALYH